MRKITKQYNNLKIGQLLHMTYQTLPMVGLVTAVIEVFTFFGVWQTVIKSIFPWMTVPIFLGFIVVMTCVAVFLNYKFIYLGYYHFQNTQQFPEDSPMMVALRKTIKDEMQKEFEELKKELQK